MGDAAGEFLLIMCYHYEGFVRAAAEGVYYVLDEGAVSEVKSVQGFVQYEQFGILDKGAGQETQALFAAAEFEEGAVSEVFYSEDAHPMETDLFLFGLGTCVQAY